MRWLFLIPGLVWAQIEPGFPLYSAGSIANAAANVAGLYAPNTLVSIYGVNLAVGTASLTAADVQNGSLPVVLGASQVRVLVNRQFANIIYASPQQVNILIPTQMVAGPATIQVVNAGRAGPEIRVEFGESAPGLFESGDGYAIATHGNGPLVSEGDPARRGEVLVLYATGLGPTAPLTPPNRLAASAAWLVRRQEFEVWLNGTPVPAEDIQYVGVTPGFGGLFQINLKVPENAPADPEIRVGTRDRMSPEGPRLRVR